MTASNDSSGAADGIQLVALALAGALVYALAQYLLHSPELGLLLALGWRGVRRYAPPAIRRTWRAGHECMLQ